MKVLVSVICQTYNHSRYIRQCLDGFIMQQTSFPFEVIVHDDASTDGTQEIISDYAKRFPDIVKPIFQKNNQWKLGKTMSKTFIYPLIQGRYVAFCEGDDYWTDALKLEKQVSLMESRPDVSVCFHPVTIHWEDGSKPDSVFPSSKQRFNKVELGLEELLKRNFIQTNSVVYRWRFHQDSLSLIPDSVLPGDWFLHLLHAQVGKIVYIDENMGVYRKHAHGIWFGAYKDKSWYKSFGFPVIRFFEAAEKQFGVNYQADIYKILLASYCYAIKYRDYEWITKLRKFYPIDETRIKSSRIKLLVWRLIALLSFGSLRKHAIYQKNNQKLLAEIEKTFNE